MGSRGASEILAPAPLHVIGTGWCTTPRGGVRCCLAANPAKRSCWLTLGSGTASAGLNARLSLVHLPAEDTPCHMTAHVNESCFSEGTPAGSPGWPIPG